MWSTTAINMWRNGLHGPADVAYLKAATDSGEFTIDGVDKEDDQFNTGWGVGLGYSLTRNFGLKFTYIGLYNHSDTGADSNSLMLGASYFW